MLCGGHTGTGSPGQLCLAPRFLSRLFPAPLPVPKSCLPAAHPRLHPWKHLGFFSDTLCGLIPALTALSQLHPCSGPLSGEVPCPCARCPALHTWLPGAWSSGENWRLSLRPDVPPGHGAYAKVDTVQPAELPCDARLMNQEGGRTFHPSSHSFPSAHSLPPFVLLLFSLVLTVTDAKGGQSQAAVPPRSFVALGK